MLFSFLSIGKSSIFQSLSPLLKLVTHSELKELLLPAMTKSMLRNPEIVMEAIANILAGLSVDLSQYAQEVSLRTDTSVTPRNSVH
jgi:hypothetical protein